MLNIVVISSVLLTAAAAAAPAASAEPRRIAASEIAGSKAPASWRLVRSKVPRSNDDVVSIMKTADTLQSDPDFAGLMVRCTKGKIDVLVVLVTPFPPQSRPQVTIAANQAGASETFEGTMAAAGAAIVLPDQAARLPAGPWQSVSALSLRISQGETDMKGVVALDGLRAAYGNLVSSCLQ